MPLLAFDRAVDALDGGRMGHAMLLCGPARLGKRVVADRLASHLLGAGHDARAASLIAAGTHPDLLAVGLEPNREGTRMRTEIVIEQVRVLTGKLALTAQYGQARVAIVDPADAINHAAANALLKTLEEPQPGRYLWLVAAEPMRLPATIRSRCQRLEFRLPPRNEALAWLQSQGHAGKAAAEALDAARGHPGIAEHWLREGGMALRAGVATDLDALAAGTLAPSEIELALAAVMVPSFLKAGLSAGILSRLAVSGCSSSLTTTSPLREVTVTGTISASSEPSLIAACARRSDSMA